MKTFIFEKYPLRHVQVLQNASTATLAYLLDIAANVLPDRYDLEPPVYRPADAYPCYWQGQWYDRPPDGPRKTFIVPVAAEKPGKRARRRRRYLTTSEVPF